MPGLRSVEAVALGVGALRLARQAGAEAARGIRAARGAVALAAGPVLLVLAPVGLGLLLSISTMSETLCSWVVFMVGGGGLPRGTWTGKS